MKDILAIDIGTSKTVVLIAHYNDFLSITGVGVSTSKGIKKGTIINIEEAAKSIKEAFNDAKRIAGVDVRKAVISVPTSYTKSIISFGIINIPSSEIQLKEISRAIDVAIRNANIPKDYEILQVIPINFKVDDMSDIEDPLGMSGTRLEVNVHIITIQKSGLENIKKTISQAGLEIENLVSTPYASGLAVLKDDEKELGVTLIDIGASTSDLGIFINKSLRYTDNLGIGSHHITNDLSVALHTPINDAEALKINFEELVKSGKEIIEIPIIGGNEEEKQMASLETITYIISARIEETLLLLGKKIEKSGLKKKIGAGVVLTGGFTNFYNIKTIASQFFDGMPVRIGYPKEIDGVFENLKKPEFSCVIGLLLYSIREGINYEIDSNKRFLCKKFEEDEELPTIDKIKEKEEEEKEETTDFIIKNDKNKPKPSIFQKLKIWLGNLF